MTLFKKKKKNFYIPRKSKNKGKEKLTPFERYMKYFKKWFNHFKNLEISDKIKIKISNLKNELIKDKSILESDLNFLEESITTIIDGNRALKYIFIFQYFLDDEDAEDLINNDLDILQNQVDSLLELVELDYLPNILKINDKSIFKKNFLEYKDHIISLISQTESFKKNLIDDIQNYLYDKLYPDRINKLRNEYSIYKIKVKKKRK